MKRTIIGITAAVMLASCGAPADSTVAVSTATENDTASLTVAVMPTLDCLPLFVAHDRGLFSKHDVSVRLVEYTAHMDCDTALQNGSVDGMMSDLVRTEYMQKRNDSIRLRYVTATELHWQLITNKTARLRHMAQLDDKMIAMTRHSATARIADDVAEKGGISPERLFRIQINDVGVRLSMLETGVMDAVLLPEPQATQARRAGGNVIMDTRQQQDVRYGVLAFVDHRIASTEKKRLLEGMMAAYNEACDSINKSGLKAYGDVVMRHCNVKAETVGSLPDDFRYNHAASPRQKDIEAAKEWVSEE